MKEIFRLRYMIILTIILCFILFLIVNMPIKRNFVSSLVIFGDNITTDYKPFIENEDIYISVDTIKKVIDENILYDVVTSKVIITTHDNVVKYKINENKMNVNLEDIEIKNSAKVIEKQAYLPIYTLENIYNIKVIYNKAQNLVCIDKENDRTGIVLNNKIDVYDDIETNSNIISKLNKDSKITVYTESLKHNRWYKIKTEDNYVGYVFKNDIKLDEIKNENNDSENSEIEKVVMYWQYGNNLETLTKESGVNVVSPTLYELKNSKGEITSRDAKNYVAKAKTLGYKVWPIITNGIDNTNYSVNDTSLLMNSENARENLIRNIIDTVDRDNLDGINIDFENMKVDDKDMFSQFIRELAPLMRKKGKVLSVDVYFVAYIDRKAVGKAADYVVLMGYDQRGAWSNSAGSISEISWVDTNVKSLIEDSKISPNSIILGIPFYTRLWTEKAGVEKPTTTIYTIKEAAAYISKNGLKPSFDEKSGQNYIEYTKGNLTYKMWLEDSTSIKSRVNIVNTNKLGGIAAWRKGFETNDVWKVINDNLEK